MLGRLSALVLLLTVCVGALRPTFVNRPAGPIPAVQSPLFIRTRNAEQHTNPADSVVRLLASADDERQVEEETLTEESLGTKIDSLRQKLRNKLEVLEDILNEFGQGSKPKALEYRGKAQEAELKALKKYKYVILSWLCYSAFIAYRAFRGFFVILPAVFQETYRKMENAVDYAPLLDQPMDEDVNPKTGKVRLRTKATVTVLTAIIMSTYVVGGLMRVLGSFSKKLVNKASAYLAFEAAAHEMLSNEKKMMKISSKKMVNGDGEASELAP